MESENIVKQRAEAVEFFIKNQKDTYLNMVYKTKQRLGMALGFSPRITTLAEGIMNEVFSDIIDGTREWNREKYKLVQVLWMNIKSEVSARIKKEKRFVPTMALSKADEDDGKCVDDLINTLPDDVEGSVDAETIESHCFDIILKDDEDAQIVLNEMLKGKTQKEIADDLGLSIRESESKIRSIRRRVSRQLPRYMLEHLPDLQKEKILNQK